VLIPIAHPVRAPGREQSPVHIAHDHLPLDLRHPERHRVGGQIVARRKAKHLPRGQQLGFLASREVNKRTGRIGMAAALHQPNGIVNDHGSTPGEDVSQRHAFGHADENVLQVPETHQTFLPGELLVQERGADGVRLGLPIEAPKPGHALGCISRLTQTAHQDEAPDGTHGPARHRIADDDLVLPLRLQDLIPIPRRFSPRHRPAVKGDDGGGAVDWKVEIPGTDGSFVYLVSPRGPVGREQRVPDPPVEDHGGATEPDVRLWVDPLEAEPVENLLRSHVQPADINVRPLSLERPFEQNQLVAPVGRVKHDWRAVVV